MKNHRLVHETPNHYVLHDGTGTFDIAKKGLGKDVVEAIKKLPPFESPQKLVQGGEVKPINDAEEAKWAASQGLTYEPADYQSDTMKALGEEDARKAGLAHGANGGFPREPASVTPNLLEGKDDLVQQEMARLAVNSGIPGVTTTGQNTSGADLSQFRTQAETNVAKTLMQNQQNAASNAQADFQAQLAKVQEDNKVRAAAGLPLLPEPAAPGSTASPAGAPVPADQQVPFSAPQSAAKPASGEAGADMLGQFNRAANQLKSANTELGNIQSEGMKQNAALMDQYVQDEKARQAQFQVEDSKMGAELDKQRSDILNAKTDPNRYWNNKSTGGKIASVLGVIFSGIGSGLTHQPNLALEMLQKETQQDIDAQMKDQETKQNVYRMGLERFRDQRAAHQYATLQANNILQAQIAATAARIGSPEALAKAKQMNAQLDMQNIPLRQNLAMQSAAMKMMNAQPSAGAGVNPDKLHAMIVTGVIPKEEHASAMKEYGDYQQLNNVLAHTEEVFKKARENATYGERILGAHGPTVSDKSKIYEAATNAYLEGLTHDTAGRVTPENVKLFRSSLPQAGDSDKVYNEKLNNVKDMLKQKYSFPTLTTYKLLNKQDPAATLKASRANSIPESAPVK